MSKFLGYSWSLDFYHPSILVNSERPAARNAGGLWARPTKPEITPHVPLSSPHGSGHFGGCVFYRAGSSEAGTREAGVGLGVTMLQNPGLGLDTLAAGSCAQLPGGPGTTSPRCPQL